MRAGSDSDATEATKLTRRRLIERSVRAGVGLAVGTQLGALARGRPLARAAANLRIGIYGYMPQGVPFDQIVKAYEQGHPGTNITVDPIGGSASPDWPSIVRRFTLEARQRRSSVDLLIGPTPWIEPAPLAQTGAIEPLDALVPKRVFNDLYRPVLREATYSDGKVYVLPWWSDVTGFIYRRSYLQKGVGTAKPPETWDQVLAYAAKLRAKYGARIYAYGADWAFSHRLFLPIFVTLTKQPYDKNGVWNVEDPAFAQTLELIEKLHAFMPAVAEQDLGSGKVFQAGGLAMETYWQPQVLRAIQAGQPANDIAMASNPRGRYTATIFWTAGAVVPKYAPNKEEAARFMVEGMLSPFAVEKTFGNWKIVPYHSILQKMGDKLPGWAKPLLGTLSESQPIPMNPYWVGIEQPVFKEELERMVLQGQSVETTRANMAKRIKDKLAELGVK